MELAVTEMEIEVALDSGSVAHVASPNHLPPNAVVIPNETGRHFQGANESHIENYGTCRARLQDQKTRAVADCTWSAAEVVRPFHALCKIALVAGPQIIDRLEIIFRSKVAVRIRHRQVVL